MANALVNLGLSMATNPDNRRLAIDMAVVLGNWEKRRIQGGAAPAPDSPGKRTADQAGIKVLSFPPLLTPHHAHHHHPLSPLCFLLPSWVQKG